MCRDYLDSANCFDTTNENILSDTYCARQLNCQGFQQDVTQNGELIKLRLSHMSFIFLTFVSVCFDFPLFNISFELGLIVVALSSSKVPFFRGVVLQAAHHVLMGNILPTPLSAFAMKVFTATQLWIHTTMHYLLAILEPPKLILSGQDEMMYQWPEV